MRRGRWLAFALLLPVALSFWLLLISIWLGLWGAANLALAVRHHSLDSLSRAVDGAARSAGVSAWLATGWGALAPVVPAMQPVADAGSTLRTISAAGLELAPVLPSALGADGPKLYLLNALNDAELFGSGGAPLNYLVLEADEGYLSVPVSGSVSAELNPVNEPYPWVVDGGMPWYRPGSEYPFANSNFHPDFGVSGSNMGSAWSGLGRSAPDGVVTIDVAAVAAVLEAIGPFDSTSYGRVTSGNVLRKLLVDSYRDYPEEVPGANERRKELNTEFQSELIDQLRDWRTALRASVAVWDAIPGRHVQAAMVDPALQRVVEVVGAEGELSRGPGDLLGVFSQSGPSKLAIFQDRQISHVVTVGADGSAQIRQTTIFTSSVPDDLRGDPDSYRGYLALLYRQRVAFRIPESAQRASVQVLGGQGIVRAESVGPYPDSVGAQVLWQGQDIPPGGVSSTVVTYSLPAGTFGGSGQLEYLLAADPQATVRPALLDVTVDFPPGWISRSGGEQVQVDGPTAHWTGVLDRPVSLRLVAEEANIG